MITILSVEEAKCSKIEIVAPEEEEEELQQRNIR
jgi:hypothetical protein